MEKTERECEGTQEECDLMDGFILKGDIGWSVSKDEMRTVSGGYLVCAEGVSLGVFEELPKEYRGLPLRDLTGKLIVPGLTDLHIHAPQYEFRGTAMDLELIEWLDRQTFPAEVKYGDTEYAERAYAVFADQMKKSATTRACIFATRHSESTKILMDHMEATGIVSFVGKINMDRNAPEELREDSVSSAADTVAWLESVRGKYERTFPILTPRFIPSCTDELMRSLAEIRREYALPVQSHLSENSAEMKWVRQLHPDCRQYWETYAKYGLWNERTVMAHCVWSDSRERQAMKDAGVTVVHCADSNQNICSGVAPVRVMLDEGLKVALGSDIAGGDHLDFFDVTASAIRASKARRMMDGWETPFLTVAESWYLATSAGAAYFGEKPGFAVGNPLHAMVLADDTLPAARPLTPAERLERAVYRRQEGAVRAVWSAGKKIYTADEKGQRSKP